MLVSATQQSEPAICTHISSPFWIPLSSRSPQHEVDFPVRYNRLSVDWGFSQSPHVRHHNWNLRNNWRRLGLGGAKVQYWVSARAGRCSTMSLVEHPWSQGLMSPTGRLRLQMEPTKGEKRNAPCRLLSETRHQGLDVKEAGAMARFWPSVKLTRISVGSGKSSEDKSRCWG